jgi:undecaprenyl-diphosphatase
MAWDQAGFQVIYSMTGNPLVDSAMYFLAEFLILLVPLTLTYLWFQSREGKEDAVFTAYSTVAGVLFTYFMGLFYAHENPSAVYDTVISYHPENSFPSQHTTAMFAAAFPLLYRDRKSLGWVMAAAGVLTGFSRIYIGEHWPIDILGALIAGAAGLGIAYLSWEKLEAMWRPVIDVVEELEEKVLRSLRDLRRQ